MKPVYQMILEPNGNNSLGLVFSEESEDFNQPVFVLPINENDSWWDERYYFPGEINGDYTEFELTFKDSLFLINDNRLDHSIRFAIGYDYFLYRIHPRDWRFLYEDAPLKYLGKHDDLVKPFSRFIPLNPLDLLIMDISFKKHQTCFVGLTPVFGERKRNEQ